MLQRICGVTNKTRLKFSYKYILKKNKMKDFFILKDICEKIYMTGQGDFWFQEGIIGNEKGFVYKLCSKAAFLVLIFIIILEILAAAIGDFPEDEKRDALTFAVVNMIILMKLSSVMRHKELVRGLNRDLTKACEIYEDYKLMKQKYNLIRISGIAAIIITYSGISLYVFEGFKKLLINGTHFIVIVTYYPSFDDNSLPAVSFRIFCTIFQAFFVIPAIIAMNVYAVALMVSIKYKYITLRNYFEGLEEEFNKKKMSVSLDEASDNLKKGLIDGIVMHQDLLRIMKNYDQSFGFFIALQVCESFVSAISLLLTAMLDDQLTPANAVKSGFFIVGLVFRMGMFMCNAAEITYQASLLPDSIFYCGWYACSKSRQRDVAKLVLISGTVAQKPIVMKSFKMLDLTYDSFISVLRAMYSVFTLIYAQNEK